MHTRVMFGDRYDYESTEGVTQMYVNGSFVSDVHSSGNIERDIGLLMLGYCE